LGFQILENSTIFIEKENTSIIGGVLLHNVILSCELDELYKEAERLKTNAMQVNVNEVLHEKIKNVYVWLEGKLCTSLRFAT
jgi:hypothetical protein